MSLLLIIIVIIVPVHTSLELLFCQCSNFSLYVCIESMENTKNCLIYKDLRHSRIESLAAIH